MVGSKQDWDDYARKMQGPSWRTYPHASPPSETPDAPHLKRVDPNVCTVTEKYFVRARQGMEKYGVDTTRKDLSTTEWLVHLQEELMDATVYIERLLGDIDDIKQNL